MRLAPLLLTLVVFLGVSFSPPGPTRAQTAPAQPPRTDPTLVEELIVRASGGPAWWRVSDRDTTVYILGDPLRVPSSVAWETRTLDRRLSGANEVILPPTDHIGMPNIFAAIEVNQRLGALRIPGETMEASLPAGLSARFAAARETLGAPASRYGGQPPAVAAMLLNGEAYHAAAPWRAHQGTSNALGADQLQELVWRTVKQRAEAQGVRTRHSAEYGFSRTLAFLDDISRPDLACVEALLADLEGAPATWVPSSGETEAAAAWADGDVRPMLAFQQTVVPQTWMWFDREDGNVYLRAISPACVGAMTGLRAFGTRMRTAQVEAIERALRRPGHAIAVVAIRDLVSRGGVLEQLKAKGYTLTLPNVD